MIETRGVMLVNMEKNREKESDYKSNIFLRRWKYAYVNIFANLKARLEAGKTVSTARSKSKQQRGH